MYCVRERAGGHAIAWITRFWEIKIFKALYLVILKFLVKKQDLGEFNNIKGYINAQTAPLCKSWFYSYRCFCLILCNSNIVKHRMVNFASFYSLKQSSFILHSRYNVLDRWEGQRADSKLDLYFMLSTLSTQRVSSGLKCTLIGEWGPYLAVYMCQNVISDTKFIPKQKKNN